MEDLWKIRKHKRVTIGELAGRTGIPAKQLRRYEMGEIPIPLDDIDRLARALYVEPWEIKIQSDPPPPPPPGEVGAPASPPAPPAPGAPPARPAPTGGPRPPYGRPPGPPRGEHGPHPTPEGGPPRNPPSERRPPRRERPDRAQRPPPPPGPVRQSQVAHLVSLGKRLGQEQADLENQVGKPLSEMNRREASLLLGTLQRRIVEENPVRPKNKRQRPYLPESVDEYEFTYLTAAQQQGATFDFYLFDNSRMSGQITGFSPYAITVRDAEGAEITLQKLAIAYYRRTAHEASS